MIVTLSDAFLSRLTPSTTRMVRDKVLCGLCIRVGKRVKTFVVATSCKGKQVRVTLGRFPLVSVDQARRRAMEILIECREGTYVGIQKDISPITVREQIVKYAQSKKLKESSLNRYISIMKTHFGEWLEAPVTSLKNADFAARCADFAATKGAALVEVGRGFIGAFIKYSNAVSRTNIPNPFASLGAAGLLPAKSKPRARKLQKEGLPQWYIAVSSLPAQQRDYLLLLAFTGLRRNEGSLLTRQNIDWDNMILSIPDTKTNKPHALPITPIMESVLRTHYDKAGDGLLFSSMSAEHVAEMAVRAGAPKFILHDLRKMLASIGEQIAVSPSYLRKILNHTAKRSDTLYRHYISVELEDAREPLQRIQAKLSKIMEIDKHIDDLSRRECEVHIPRFM